MAYAREAFKVFVTGDLGDWEAATKVQGQLAEMGMAAMLPQVLNSGEIAQARKQIEAQAKAARRGLWADENPEPPWDWRRRNRGMFPADDEPPFDPLEGPDSDALTAGAVR